VPEPLRAYEAAPYSYPEARTVAEELGLSDPVAVTLVRRGYRTPEAARAFLEADESHPPEAFESMAEIVGLVRAAIDAGRKITVHGDFDVDGVCATTTMVSTLRELGAECDWLIPDRMADGYGLSAANVERLAQRGTSLILTVDCGITAVEEVRLARELGMEVVVTDHHQPADELPDCPILHPVVSGYPFAELCGTAVAWKLACALRAAAGSGSPGPLSRRVPGDPATATADLDLVALATVADVVPLIGENRSLVRRGLEVMRRGRRAGLRALIGASKVELAQLNESDLGFKLGPRINAAGRLYRADAGVELFLTADDARAEEIAVELNRANGERRKTEREVDGAAEAARRELSDELREAPGLVLAGAGWHPGVIGIVASRLAERHYRPVVMISLDGEGGGRGSGRSIPGFDLLAALDACSEHLVSFGGHRAAAGLELRAESLDAFRAAFAAHAAAVLGPEDLRRTERIDAMVGGAGLDLDLAEELGRLAPFGMGNPGVRLLVPSARVSDVRTMGEGKHSRFNLHSGSHRALGVAFGKSSLGVADDESVDAAVRLEVNHWNGSVEPRVVLRELFPPQVGVVAENPGAREDWWRRFEAELEADPAATPSDADDVDKGGNPRRVVPSSHSPAAVLAELVSSGDSVLAIAADAAARIALDRAGMRLADYPELERSPGLPLEFTHVVLVDPPPFARLRRLAERCADGEGYLHPVWGEAERRFSLSALRAQCARRDEIAAVFRGLRDAGEASGEDLRRALSGADPIPRRPEVAARCFRVLVELELVQAPPEAGGGAVGVVSSEGTNLERSAAFRAYGARFKEGKQYLEGLKHP
jgi:single-stranded-DNA-specific exonuclease